MRNQKWIASILFGAALACDVYPAGPAWAVGLTRGLSHVDSRLSPASLPLRLLKEQRSRRKRYLKPRQTSTASTTRGALTFETLGRSDSPATEPSEATAWMALSATELEPFARLLNAEHQQKLTRVDFSADVVIAVFAGVKGSSGHEITLRRITRAGQGLHLTASQRGPAPNDAALTVMTSPYHVVRVARAAFKGSFPSSWILFDDKGRRLSAGRFDER